MQTELTPRPFGPNYFPSLGELTDRTAEGIGKVLFQKNVATGLLILAAVFLSSWSSAIGCLFGAGLATFATTSLRSERTIPDTGTFALNGALTGIAVFTLTGVGSTLSSLLNVTSWVWTTAAVLISMVIVNALSTWLHLKRLPVLSAPYCGATWLCVAALKQFSGLSVSVVGGDTNLSPMMQGGTATLFIGTLNGISNIFLQHGWLPALLILFAISIQSKLAAAVGVTGALLGSIAAVALGAPDTIVQSGIYTCNAVMTAIFLAGVLKGDLKHRVFCCLSWSILAIVVSAATTSFFQPFGLPILLFPSVVVCWACLAAARSWRSFSDLVPDEGNEDHIGLLNCDPTISTPGQTSNWP